MKKFLVGIAAALVVLILGFATLSPLYYSAKRKGVISYRVRTSVVLADSTQWMNGEYRSCDEQIYDPNTQGLVQGKDRKLDCRTSEEKSSPSQPHEFSVMFRGDFYQVDPSLLKVQWKCQRHEESIACGYGTGVLSQPEGYGLIHLALVAAAVLFFGWLAFWTLTILRALFSRHPTLGVLGVAGVVFILLIIADFV